MNHLQFVGWPMGFSELFRNFGDPCDLGLGDVEIGCADVSDPCGLMWRRIVQFLLGGSPGVGYIPCFLSVISRYKWG